MTTEQSGSLDHDDNHDLTLAERERLSAEPNLSEFQRQKLDKDAKKNWDLFYKRNGNRFFKNRYWTRNEFNELYENNDDKTVIRYLLEVGCGCGDFVLPFLEEDDENQTQDSCDNNDRVKPDDRLFIYCCDISDKAISILKENTIYEKNYPTRIKAFVADMADDDADFIGRELDNRRMDLVSMIFVLSAVDPRNMKKFLINISRVLKPDGLVLFRDYAIYDKAMLRFGRNSKICDQFYVRQDGTRAYFFSKEQLADLFQLSGFKIDSIDYVKRETTNHATKESFSRIFLQAKFRKR